MGVQFFFVVVVVVVVVISDSSIVTGAILYVDSLSLWDFHDG